MLRKHHTLLVTVGVVVSSLLVYFVVEAYSGLIPLSWNGIKFGFIAFLLGTCLLIVLDIASKEISSEHSMRGIIDHYLAIRGLSVLGYFMSRRLDKSTKHCKATQEQMLLKHLHNNENTEYGERYSFRTIESADEFIKRHPLTRYAHYESYIERIGKGEQRILTEKPPYILAVTSGTSGKSSMLPFTKPQSGVFFLQGISIIYRYMLNAYPELKSLRKNLKFFYTPRWRTSEAGILIGPNSSSPTNSKSILNLYTTPLPGFEILDEREALYVHLLFGLKDKTLGMIEANFASLIHTAFVFLEHEWKDLVNDIESGKVNANLNISNDIRSRLNDLLKPDPSRAEELRNEFEKGFNNIAKRIWPGCNLLLCADTGTFKLYGDSLKRTYCKDIPVYSPIYAATEGLIGINIWPLNKDAEYLLLPEGMFCEFIPLEHSEEQQPSTQLMHQVEVGQDYELVITNISGLYRYRFGDVVRVTRFHNNCPVVEFLYRQGQLLNVRGEKTSEKLFYQTLLETVDDWPGVILVDYCCAESILMENGNSAMPHYIVFLELEKDGQPAQLTSQQKDLLDTKLRQSFVYDSFRKKESIGKMAVHEVKKDSFKYLREFMIQTTNASPNQYKVPRVLRHEDAFKFIMTKVE